MKTFTIHSVRNVSAFFIALGLGYMAYTVSPNSVEIPKAEAGASQNVSGWAYSKGGGTALNDGNTGIGWISFNSYDCDVDKNGFVDSTGNCGGNNTSTIARDYGVNINTTTGNFSGYAYSEFADAISFTSTDLSICPVGATVAKVDLSTGNVTGWARALTGSATSGWDGCIKFSDETNSWWAGKGVKMDISTGEFSGYAYGGDVIGWISFNCSTDGSCGSSNYFVQGPELNCTNFANNPPTCTQCPDGQFYNTISSQCYSCSGTGCNGTGGTTSPGNEFGSLSCNGGTTNVPGCNACPQLEVLVGNSCENSIGNGTCDIDAGENLTNSPVDCKPKTRFWQF